MKQPATSAEIYDTLKALIPGLPDSNKIRSLKIVLEADEPAVVVLETYVADNHLFTSTKLFNLTERPE